MNEVVDYNKLKKAVSILRTLNHRLRQEIIELINKEREITVTDIFVKLRLEQSVASQQLSLLRKAGVVTRERKGKCVYYSINHKRLTSISALVDELCMHEAEYPSKKSSDRPSANPHTDYCTANAHFY